jgi:hypothetical protein
MMGWPGLAIHRNKDSVMVTSVVAFTKAHPARIAGELANWKRQLAPSAPASPDLTGESSSSAPSS